MASSASPTPTSSTRPNRGDSLYSASCGGTTASSWATSSSFGGAGGRRQQRWTEAGPGNRQSSHAGDDDHRAEHAAYLLLLQQGHRRAQWVSARSCRTEGQQDQGSGGDAGQPAAQRAERPPPAPDSVPLADARKNRGKIYAALYELNDKELIPALQAFGKDCNLILANGAFKPPTNDENADVRATLKNKINLFDRIVTGSHFAHNKFVVFCDADGKPRQVLTGSTNWTSSGLCTQANNGLITTPVSRQDFLDAGLGSGGRGTNTQGLHRREFHGGLQCDGLEKVTPWFASTSAAQDLELRAQPDRQGQGRHPLSLLQSRAVQARADAVDVAPERL